MRVRCVCLLFFFAVCFSMGAETPPGNIDYVMEYFPKAGGIVMHGGWCEPDWLPRNDVWVLDNNGWRHVIQDSSPAFAHHSMTFNTDRKVLVLCGNTTYTTFTSEYQTWEYDGTDWSRGPELPTEIIFGDVELAYDQARQVTVLYLHGFLSDFSPRTETWEYNGVTWTKKEFLTAPVACSDGALMKYDPVNRITVLVADDGSGSQTWLWDGTDWKSVAGAQPPDVLGGGMVYDTVRQEMVFLTTTMQTWVFDGTSWTQKN
ncbi:MAG TPA: hypothetical protein PK644_01500, partial [bacterium]|nr:hypothetical protein [bacterium]